MTPIMHILAIPLALLWANMMEWAVHKYVLHGWGKKKGSLWSFHWHDHHKIARKCGGHDMAYLKKKWWKLDSVGKERIGLLFLLMLHIPVVFHAPLAFLTLAYAMINYYRTHRRSHIDVEWAKKHVPWHYEHHMGRNQDANWCITKPWFDHIMGTRVKK